MGNRELGGVGRFLREELQRHTGDRVIYQRLGYLMRSGPPDSLDRLVAKNFATLAADLILAGKTGRLVSIQAGRYTTEPLEIIGEGKKQVDVEKFYDRGALPAERRGGDGAADVSVLASGLETGQVSRQAKRGRRIVLDHSTIDHTEYMPSSTSRPNSAQRRRTALSRLRSRRATLRQTRAAGPG